MPRWIDTHSHLHFPPYEADRALVLERMRVEETWTVTVGTSIETSIAGVAFADATENVWATVGYHPEHLTSAFHDETEGPVGAYDAEALRRVATSSKKIVAIGETGLDFFRIDKDRDRAEAEAMQERIFREQIALAAELDLPLVIHCRDALTRLAEVIRDEQSTGKKVRGVVHCYTGTWEEAKPLLEVGLFLSFTGIVTFPPKKSEDPERSVHRVIERMPLDRLMIETDAPWLTPVPHRGERNEPSYVRFVGETVATLRGVSVDEVSQTTTANARAFFRI